LGKLVKAQRAARMGRNPATGESIKIAAKTTVKFRLSKAAKDAVVPPKKQSSRNRRAPGRILALFYCEGARP